MERAARNGVCMSLNGLAAGLNAKQLELLILGADAGVTDEHDRIVLEDAWLKPSGGVFSGR